ncbi:helix-turn-helix domain-containing protein [Dyadobacter sp. 32]|uniref:helix-turn-helix domain-containing protein n=1 Tax=Dyadobacter sp. 32 TaxID=538966 RepID=UPI0011EE7A1E
MTDIGKNIKKAREAISMSQEEFAIKMGKSGRGTVSNWETGKNEPTISDIRKIADILKTTVSALLGEDIVTEGSRPDMMYVSKDEFIELQRKALKREEEANEELRKRLEQVQNG